MGQVGSNTRRVDDIVERELIHQRRKLEEEGQGLISMSVPVCRNIEIRGCEYLSDTARGAGNN
jgi:hypothetical protein